MPRPIGEKLPWGPFARFYGPAVRSDFLASGCRQEVDVEIGDVALLMGVSKRGVIRFVADGIPLWRADHLAITLGVHPSAIWPDWFDRAELAS